MNFISVAIGFQNIGFYGVHIFSYCEKYSCIVVQLINVLNEAIGFLVFKKNSTLPMYTHMYMYCIVTPDGLKDIDLKKIWFLYTYYITIPYRFNMSASKMMEI